MIGSMLGWIMTCSYVGSRIPQLVKNYRRGMTTGLSLPMFVLLVLGSTTYVASIFVRSGLFHFFVFGVTWKLSTLQISLWLHLGCCCADVQGCSVVFFITKSSCISAHLQTSAHLHMACCAPLSTLHAELKMDTHVC